MFTVDNVVKQAMQNIAGRNEICTSLRYNGVGLDLRDRGEEIKNTRRLIDIKDEKREQIY